MQGQNRWSPYGLVLAGLLVVGCAGQQAARNGELALKQNDLDRAVESFRQATQENPKNEGFRKRLAEARGLRADRSVAAAQMERARGNLTEALARVRKGLEDAPQHAGARALQMALEKEYEEARMRLEAAKAAFAARRDLDGVVADFKALLRYQKTFAELPELLGRVERAAEGARRLAEGRRLLEANQLAAAVEALTRAAELDPERAEVTEELHKAQERYAPVLEQQAAEARQARRHGEAVEALRRAAMLLSHLPERRQQLEAQANEILRELARRLGERGNEALARSLVGLGWAYLKTAALVSPESASAALPGLDAQLSYVLGVSAAGDEDMGGQLAAALTRRLEDFGKSRRLMVAPVVSGQGEARAQATLRLYVRPLSLTTVPERVEQKSVRYVVRIDTQPNPKHQTLQTEVARLTNQLTAASGSLEAEQRNLRQLGESEEEARKERDRLKAARETLVAQQRQLEARRGEVQRQIDQIERQIRETEASIDRLSQQAGSEAGEERRKGLEAERDRARERLAQLEREQEQAVHERSRVRGELDSLRTKGPAAHDLERVEGEWKRLGTARRQADERRVELERQRERLGRDLDARRAELEKTPATLERPVEADYPYTEEYFVRRLRLEGRMELGDVRGGAAIVASPFAEELSHRDFLRREHHVQGQPDVHIDAHPLAFPSDDELHAQALERVTGRLMGQLTPQLEHHGDRFVRAARAATSEDERLNNLVYVYHSRTLLSAPEEGDRARQALRDSFGLELPEERVDLARLNGR